jgi:hypothetical protein
LADEDADVHGSLDDDDVGEGEGKTEEKGEDRELEPPRNAEAEVSTVAVEMTSKTRSGVRPMLLPMLRTLTRRRASGERSGWRSLACRQ